MAKRKDIETAKLNWDRDNIQASLDGLYQHVTERAGTAIGWYLKSKRGKKRWAIGLRAGAIVLASVAVAIPVLSQVLRKADGTPIIEPAWASVVLILGGTFVALDCFLGCSSGWVRYVVTALRIQKLLNEFQVSWNCQRSGWKQGGRDEKQTTALCVLARKFLSDIDQLILAETNAWVAEFQKALAQVEALMKAKGQGKDE
jgi:hypothetical protein